MSSIPHKEYQRIQLNWDGRMFMPFLLHLLYFYFPWSKQFFPCKCITPTRWDKSHHNLDQASAQSWPLIIWSQVMDCLQRKHFSSHTAQMFHNFRSQKIWYDISRQDGSLDWFSNSVQKAYQCTSRVRNMVWDTKLLLTA